MIAVFVPVISLSTQLTKVKTELSFAAEDPWNGNRPCTFILDSYMVTLRGVKSVPKSEQTSPWSGGFHRALRSDADGVTRFLPESLIELWLTKQVPIEALPMLLKQIEPSLTKSDYKPILRSLSMKIFGVFETICCALLLVIVVIAVVASHAPLWLAAMVVLAVACGCWVFLYQVYFGLLLRRKQQTRWLLERIRLGRLSRAEQPMKKETSHMTKTPSTPEPPRQPNALQTVIHSIKPYPTDVEPALDAPRDVRTDAIMDVPEVFEPSMLCRLRKAFPELKWEEHAENWGKVRIWGTIRGKDEHPVISILRKEPPGAFKLGITVSAPDQSEADKSLKACVGRLERALSGWSISNLPKFKPRPPSGVDINQTETVELMSSLERPHIRIIGPDADVFISKSLLEALSTHGEMLDRRAKEPKKYPGGNDEESRLAGMRGARARGILGKAVAAGPGKDTEMQLALEREAQYLVGELLENGLAQVALHRTPPISLRRIKVHYFGSRAAPTVGFGFISYCAEDADVGYFGEILHLNWWVS